MADVYQIAMELTLDDQATAGLHNVTSSLSSLVTQLEKAQSGFSALNTALLGSAGVGIVLGMLKISGAANDLTRTLTQMSMAGYDTARAMRVVEDTVTQTGARRTEVLSRYQEMLTRVGPNAAQLLTPLTRQEQQFNIMGIQGGVTPAVEAAMQRGIQDPARIQAFVEQYLRIAQSTQGIVTPQMLSNIVQRAGAGGARWSDEFLSTGLPAFLLSSTGGLGGRQNIGMALERLDQAITGPGGVARGGLSGGLNRRAIQGYLGRPLGRGDEELIATDPAAWARKVGPVLTAQYGEGNLPEVIAKMFTNPIIQRAMLFWMSSMGLAAEERQRERVAAAPGSSPEAERIMRQDPKYWLQQIGDHWTNFWEKISLQNQPEYVKSLKWVDSWIVSLTHLAEQLGAKNVSTIISGMEVLGGAVATLAAVRGLSLLLPGGLVAAAVLGIATIIGILANLKWDQAKDGLGRIGGGLAPGIPPATPQARVAGELQQGPFGDPRQPLELGVRGLIMGTLGRMMGYQPGYVGQHWPGVGELGTGRGNLIGGQMMGAFGQFPSWLPREFLPATSPHKGDVNLSVDLLMDGTLVGNVLMPKILDQYEFANGPPSTNPHTNWPGNTYTPQSQ